MSEQSRRIAAEVNRSKRFAKRLTTAAINMEKLIEVTWEDQDSDEYKKMRAMADELYRMAREREGTR